MYLSKIRGNLAQRLAKDADADSQATVRRALLALESDLPPDPQLYLQAAQYAMTLLDLDLADRFATAAASAGAPDALGVRAMNLVLLGRGPEAEEVLRAIGEDGAEGAHQWATLRAANLIWMLGRCNDAAALLEELAAVRSRRPNGMRGRRWKHASTPCPAGATRPRKRPERHWIPACWRISTR